MVPTAHLSVPLLAVALVAAVWALRRSGELEDIVSFSSRLIAAARAIESERKDALFVDPFAAVLAGPKALAQIRSLGNRPSAASTASRSLSNLTCRTKYLDDAIQFFVGGGAGSPKVAEYLNQVQEIAAGLGSATAQHLRYAQVVLLGAGMDTRAQRLDLPPGTVWFEVDRTEVLRVKHNLLCSIKRKVLHNTSITVRSAGGELGVTELEQILRGTTFNSAVPTLWILEGLTMYLSPDQNSTLLQELAELSPCGSMFLMSLVPAKSINVPRRPGSLMSTWKWGFSDTFIKDSSALGWQIVDSIDYASIAHMYGYDYLRRIPVHSTASELSQDSTPALKMQPCASMMPDCVQVTAGILCSK